MNTRRTRRPAALWTVLAGVVVLALVIAVVATGSDDDPPAEAGLAQVQPVTVTGAPLPTFGSGADAAIGAVVPELRGLSFDGTPVAITRDGRAKVVVFVAHWCPHCRREVPVIVDHLRTAGLPVNVDVVAVATSTSRDRPNYPPSQWLDREGWRAPVLVDDAGGTAAAAYGLSGFPYFAAIDRDGTLVARTSGEITTEEFGRLLRSAAR